MNYYELLGVAEDADSAAIKTAFRKKAKKYHPDTNPGNEQAEKIAVHNKENKHINRVIFIVFFIFNSSFMYDKFILS